jgi:hypothetical protein
MEQGGSGGQYETGMSSRAELRDFGRPMSVLGQIGASRPAWVMSVLPSITGFLWPLVHV